MTLGLLDVDGHVERTVWCEEHTCPASPLFCFLILLTNFAKKTIFGPKMARLSWFLPDFVFSPPLTAYLLLLKGTFFKKISKWGVWFPRPWHRSFFSFIKKVEKRQLWVQTFEWLKLNFASCVVHQTRSHNMVFVNKPTICLLYTSDAADE